MLEGESWHNSRLMVARALGRSLEADIEIDGLSRLLDEAYRHVVARAGDNPDLRFETVADKMGIVVTPLDKLDEPESLRALRAAVQTRMPKAGMPDIFLEVMARTDRKSGVSGKRVSVRVDLGGRRIIKKTNKKQDRQ